MSSRCFTIFALLVLGLSAMAWGTTYTITEITAAGSFNGAPVINANGTMAWVFSDGVTTDIVIYDGVIVTRLETPDWIDMWPSINDNGEVVWVGRRGDEWDVYYYDGEAVKRLYSPGVAVRYPYINNNGWIVWECDARLPSIYLYNGETMMELSQPDNSFAFNPSINNNNEVVWSENPGTGWHIYMYSGGEISQLPDSVGLNVMPKISDGGYVAWMGTDYVNWEIYLFDGLDVQCLEQPGSADMLPVVNNAGQVAWISTTAAGADICLFNGVSIQRLDTPGFTDSQPQINEAGAVVWQGDDGLDVEIFLYDGQSLVQLTDNDIEDLYPQINELNEVAWQGVTADGAQIVVAEPGDATPPTIGAINASPDVMWPPNHKMVPVKLTVQASDDSGEALTCRVVEVASNEPQDGLGDGDTPVDWQITGDTTLNLRAERSGSGSGRVYTLTVEVADPSGNTATGTVQVRVPKSQGKK